MRDPAYQLVDPYVGKDGIDWIERWSDALHKSLPLGTWEDPPAQIVREYDSVNNDRH